MLRLAHEDALHALRQDIFHKVSLGVFTLQPQCCIELVIVVEVVLDCTLVAAGDKDECVDASPDCLLGGVLNEGFVHDRQKLLRHRLCGGQKPGPKSCNGEDGLTDLLHQRYSLCLKCALAHGFQGFASTLGVSNHSCQFVRRCVLADCFAGETQLGKTLRGQSARPKAL